MSTLIISKTMQKSCPVPLTDNELRFFGEKNAQEVQRLIDIEEAKKEANADFKNRIDSAKSEVQRLTRIVNEKREWRSVECQERINWAESSVEIVRLDTGEVIGYRSLSDNERQLNMRLE